MAAGLGDMSANGRSDVDGVAVTHAFILLSDGRPYPDPANRPDPGEVGDYLSAVDQAFGIAIGEGGVGPNNPDLVLMNDLSKPAGDPSANFYHVLDAGDLPDIFSAIAEQLLCGDIQIEKIPDPAGPVDPGTVVTYTYNVWNEGDTPLSGVTVEDDTCSPVVYVSGKSGNNLLEKGEIWTYACSMPLQQSTKNEACAEGNFIGGGQASACVDVTVEVKEPASSTPTPEGSVEAGTGTPSESIGDAAVNVPGSSVLPTIVFSFVLVTSLGTLARASVRAQRRRS
jgi:uncharacterized repeat protein (TIGR01451 family)